MTSKGTVFVVDDDEAVLDSLKASLETVGFTVEVYQSGLDFLESNDPPRKGCLLLDVRMPDIDGLEMQRRLEASRDRLPIIIMTGHGDVTMAVTAMKAGAFDFIEKPFTDETLLEAIERALEHTSKMQRRETSVGEIEEKIRRLTARERDVFEQLVIGRPNKVIAFELGISPRTVEVHRSRVIEKLQARSLSQLVRMAMAIGLQLDDG